MQEINLTFSDAALIARDICMKHNRDGSIFTSRVLKSALEQFGFSSIVPMSVRVLIFNPYVTNEFKINKSPSKKRLNALLNHPRGHSVALGFEESNGNDWKGHLVLIAKNSEGTWLIDATLIQANRPEHKIWMLPIGVKVADGFGTFDGSRAIVKLNDSSVIYSSFPSDKSYEHVEDWHSTNEEFDAVNVSNQIFERFIEGS